MQNNYKEFLLVFEEMRGILFHRLINKIIYDCLRGKRFVEYRSRTPILTELVKPNKSFDFAATKQEACSCLHMPISIMRKVTWSFQNQIHKIRVFQGMGLQTLAWTSLPNRASHPDGQPASGWTWLGLQGSSCLAPSFLPAGPPRHHSQSSLCPSSEENQYNIYIYIYIFLMI